MIVSFLFLDVSLEKAVSLPLLWILTPLPVAKIEKSERHVKAGQIFSDC
ncbi:MAG: hypothetical protein LBG17_08405 [Bacteroidales bacterium]|jgi:hypothetical protein|nr:hypothetical protein [Bacteroidales bacterium]